MLEATMRVTFVGVGEAFDEQLANTSLLVETSKSSLLVDCGFTAPAGFWKIAKAPLELDGVYVTHFHGDHYFGLPALLVRSIEEGRTKPLTIMGQAGIGSRVEQLMELAYPNSLGKAQFPLEFVECDLEQEVKFGDMDLQFAMNDHPMPCMSIRIDCKSESLFYSGDGRPTSETRALAAGCDLVIHESFSLEPETPGHGTVDSSIAFGREAGAKTVALVHIHRGIRSRRMSEIMRKCEAANGVDVVIPLPGDVIYS